ncbi:hypothetical protein BJX99DRAFT_264365 [Aspergillus californicus]
MKLEQVNDFLQLLRYLFKRRTQITGAVPFSLTEIPDDIIARVGTFLAVGDLCRLRLASSYIAQCTSRHFKLSYLQLDRVCCDLSYASIKRLKRLSKNSELAHQVHEISIVSREFQKPWENRQPLGGWKRNKKDAIIMNQRGIKILQSALKGLINCRSFTIRRRPLPTHLPTPSELSCSEAAMVICRAMTKAKLDIESFTWELDYIREFFTEGMGYPNFTKPSISKACANLRSFTIQSQDDNGYSQTHAVQLLRECRHVENLTITWRQGGWGCFLLHQISLSGTLTRLREIRLSNAKLGNGDGLKFLLVRTRSTLRRITLEGLQLTNYVGSWDKILHILLECTYLQMLVLNGLTTSFRGFLHFPGLDREPTRTISQGGKFRVSYRQPDPKSRQPFVTGIRYDGGRMMYAVSRILACVATEV